MALPRLAVAPLTGAQTPICGIMRAGMCYRMARKSQLFLDFDAALAHLEDETAALSSAALGALSNASPREVIAFAQVWQRLPVERRRRVAEKLVALAEENIELNFDALFRHLFADEDAAVRAASIEGLWENEDAALIAPFIAFLRNDSDARVRAAAADALGRFILLAEYGRLPFVTYATRIGDALWETIHDTAEVLRVRCRAVEALAHSSDARVRDVIRAAYADDALEMRASALAAMGHSADTYWRAIAESELASPEPRLRFEAARAVGELEDRAAVPRLIELLDDPDRQVQSVAITALGQIGGKRAQTALLRLAESEDELLRDLAEDALQELEFASTAEFPLLDVDLNESRTRSNRYEDEDNLP